MNKVFKPAIPLLTGTVLARDFSPFRADTDRMEHIIGRIHKTQTTSGKGQSLSSLYTKLRGLKDNYVRQLARWIVNLAVKSGAHGIVLEHLDVHHRTKKKGLRIKVHHWCAARIRDLIRGMALRAGIRVFTVNAKGTSMYAYDGSGHVKRGRDSDKTNGNYSICEFANGKIYNCDLSASYNIGARYFIREIKKSTPETEWSQLMAKVPELAKRTGWTLHTLRELRSALSEKASAA